MDAIISNKIVAVYAFGKFTANIQSGKTIAIPTRTQQAITRIVLRRKNEFDFSFKRKFCFIL